MGDLTVFTSPFIGSITTHTHFTDSIVRVGLNYKFGNNYAPLNSYYCTNHKPGRWLDGPVCSQWRERVRAIASAPHSLLH
jgi:hypothetical protein